MREFEKIKEIIGIEWPANFEELKAVVISSSFRVLHIATPDNRQRIYRYRIIKGGEQWKLAPMRVHLDFLVMTGHLQSTREGAWWWEASEHLREQHISRAPYRPRIDVIFSDVIVDISRKRLEDFDINSIEKDYNDVLTMYDDYWRITVCTSSRSLIVSERSMRKETFEQCRSVIPILDKPESEYRQGRLRIQVFPLKEKEYKKVETKTPIIEHHEGVMFYNHCVDALGFVRLDNEAIALPEKINEEYILKIWAPDHMWEPQGFLAIEQWSPFITRLLHPVPRDDID